MVLGEITSPWRGAGPPKSGMDKQGAWKADMEVVIDQKEEASQPQQDSALDYE